MPDGSPLTLLSSPIILFSVQSDCYLKGNVQESVQIFYPSVTNRTAWDLRVRWETSWVFKGKASGLPLFDCQVLNEFETLPLVMSAYFVELVA
jgi:hypothetical protein